MRSNDVYYTWVMITLFLIIFASLTVRWNYEDTIREYCYAKYENEAYRQTCLHEIKEGVE